jgi:hypothetical protein
MSVSHERQQHIHTYHVERTKEYNSALGHNVRRDAANTFRVSRFKVWYERQKVTPHATSFFAKNLLRQNEQTNESSCFPFRFETRRIRVAVGAVLGISFQTTFLLWRLPSCICSTFCVATCRRRLKRSSTNCERQTPFCMLSTRLGCIERYRSIIGQRRTYLSSNS